MRTPHTRLVLCVLATVVVSVSAGSAVDVIVRLYDTSGMSPRQVGSPGESDER